MSNSLVKTSAVYGIGAILTKALGFFLIPLYTRYFTVEEYGILSILNVTLQLLVFVFLLGASSAAMRFYFDPEADDEYRKEIYGNALILILFSSIILSLLFGPLGYIFFNRYFSSIPFFPYVFIIFLISPLWPIRTLMLGLLRVQKEALNYVAYTLSFFLLQMVTIIFVVAWLGYGLKGQLYAQLFANILFFIIAIIVLKRYSKISLSFKKIKRLLSFGIPLVPFFFFTWINSASGRFMLAKYVSLTEVGVFALAAQFSGLLRVLSGAFDNALLPYYYETAQNPLGAEELGNFTTKYFALFGLIALFTLFIARPMIYVMATPKFYKASIYIPSILLAGWLSLSYKLFHWNLMHTKRTALLSTISCFSALLMLVLLFLFLKHWKMKIYGVIYAMILVEVFRNIVGYILSQKYFKIKYNIKDIALSLLILALGALLINYIAIKAPLVSSVFINFIVFAFVIGIINKITKINVFRIITQKRHIIARKV